LGSRLSAVQGPPGTGKTTLILNLLCHTLVQKVVKLAETGSMGREIAVVSSTNNRAVDNVVDPLGRELEPHVLPWSLRVGSRQIVEKVTSLQLERVRLWLHTMPVTAERAQARLDKELTFFRQLYTRLKQRVGPEESHRNRLERKRQVMLEVERLRTGFDPARVRESLRSALQRLGARGPAGFNQVSCSAWTDQELDQWANHSSRNILVPEALSAFGARMTALSQLAEDSGPTALVKLRRHWSHTEKRQLLRLEKALGLELDCALPPSASPKDTEAALELWEEAAESALSAVEDLAFSLSTLGRRDAVTRELAGKEAELGRLVAATAEPPPAPSDAERAELDALQVELFESAAQVREAWALVHKEALLEAMADAIRVSRENRCLRGLMEASGRTGAWLRRLFPAWGSTLLSLGNVFPPESGAFETAILDEAGQCHPAYAVAALLRAGRALVIGDVNQLEPVVGLNAEHERRILARLGLSSTPSELASYRVYEGSATSAQSLADRAVERRPTLVDHFRCQPPIVAICEALCHYGLVARTPPRTRVEVARRLVAPVLHLSVEGSQERFAGSWVNQAELEATLALIRELLAAGIDPREIGVITPYRGQLERLWRGLREARIPLERRPAEVEEQAELELFATPEPALALGTVHRFQGGERSIVLFSTTVTSPRSLGFLNATVNLVNVAASRAKEHLITIGHGPTLLAGAYTRQLIVGATPLAL
jgi:hypothetical protein